MSARRMIVNVAALLLGCALATSGVVRAQGTGDGSTVPPPPGARAVCHDCGVVQSVRHIERKGDSSGVGAVAGGVLGGVLGHQLGSGRGNTLATIAGAGAGAYAGHQVEKNRNKKSYWTVAVRMDTGKTRPFTYGSRPPVNEGERVRLVGGGRRRGPLN